MTASLPLMKNVLISLAKSVLISLGLTAAAAATDAPIRRKFWITSLIISIEEMEVIMKIVKSVE